MNTLKTLSFIFRAANWCCQPITDICMTLKISYRFCINPTTGPNHNQGPRAPFAPLVATLLPRRYEPRPHIQLTSLPLCGEKRVLPFAVSREREKNPNFSPVTISISLDLQRQSRVWTRTRHRRDLYVGIDLNTVIQPTYLLFRMRFTNFSRERKSIHRIFCIAAQGDVKLEIKALICKKSMQFNDRCY